MICIACLKRSAFAIGDLDGYDIFRCNECSCTWRTPVLGHVRMAPDLPREGEKYLGDFYHKDFCEANAIPTFDQQFARDSATALLRLEALAKHCKFVAKGFRPYLLDVGTGNAAFVLAALDFGYDAFGVESGQALIDRQRLKYPGLRSRLTCGREPHKLLGGWNVITYHDVLEHVPDPFFQLQTAAKFAAPGCVLVVEAPDPECKEAREKGIYFRHIKPFEHTMILSAATWGEMMAGAGFDPVEVTRPTSTKLSVYGKRRKA